MSLLIACQRDDDRAADRSTTALPARAASAPDAASADSTSETPDDRVISLKPEQVAALGVKTEPARAIEHQSEISGLGVVVAHDSIAQAVSELASAQAAARQSRAALERARRLEGTPGAVSADLEETATRQSAQDAAALELARRRLSALVGLHTPWTQDVGNPTLKALADGRVKLLRATFPLGSFPHRPPTRLRVLRLAVAMPSGSLPGHEPSVLNVWESPADPTVPGSAYFGLLERTDAEEGEHLRVLAPAGMSEKGVEIPEAAVIMSESRYWCYVQRESGRFVRVPIDLDAPTAAGYFVGDAVKPGDAVVVKGASLLLAQGSNSGGAPD